MLEEVQFRYTFTFNEIQKNYEKELAESPFWRRFTIICIAIFVVSLFFSCIMTNITTWFTSVWDTLGWIPWVIFILPVFIYYQKTRVEVKRVYKELVWDGEAMNLGFDLDGYFIQTGSTYRKYKWQKAVDIIQETNGQFIIGKKDVYKLRLEKAKISNEKVIQLRKIFQEAPVEKQLMVE
jgi:hypothetical protein